MINVYLLLDMYLLYCISQKSFYCFLSGYYPSIVSNIENRCRGIRIDRNDLFGSSYTGSMLNLSADTDCNINIR